MSRRRTRGWRVGKIGGAPLILTPGSVILGALLYVLFLPNFIDVLGADVRTYLVAALLPLGLLASVLIHEVAHGLAARAYKIPVTEYVLTLWGGHTAFDHGVDKPGPSAVISVAGPGSNVVLAALAWVPVSGGVDGALDLILLAMVFVNAILAGFNLLPGLPMDGGRILEALIWAVTGNRATGTMVGARGGQVLALAVVAWGAWPMFAGVGAATRLVWAVLIAGVLWFGAQGEVRRAKALRATAGVDLGRLVEPVVVQPESATVADWAQSAGTGRVTVVVAPDHTPVGIVDPQAVESVPASARATTPLAAVSTGLSRTAVLTTTRGSDAVTQIAHAAQAGDQVAVVAPRGEDGQPRILGILSVERVVKALGA